MVVLGIETSCDETGVAIYDGHRGLLAHQVYSQIKMQAHYGGVVPELASRDHVQKLLPIVKSVLNQARMKPSQLQGVAYTAGPGLIGALMVGAMFARSFAYGLQVPAVAVHHLEAHLLAPLLEEQKPSFPFLALLVSGGHTLIVKVEAIGQYQILGESIDDAVGEAFDKTARLMGLPYPGGAALAKLAERGNPNAYAFPRPMLDRPGYDFSFSGLKTSALRTIQAESDLNATVKANIAASFQQAVVETLVAKCKKAMLDHQIKHLVVAGGVSANLCLRSRLAEALSAIKASVYYPRLELCTDNGAMIAFAGYLRLVSGEQHGLSVETRARWPLSELKPIRSI